jgi:hypothetical protein
VLSEQVLDVAGALVTAAGSVHHGRHEWRVGRERERHDIEHPVGRHAGAARARRRVDAHRQEIDCGRAERGMRPCLGRQTEAGAARGGAAHHRAGDERDTVEGGGGDE